MVKKQSRKQKQRQSRKQKQRQSRRQKQRNQRGGAADYASAFAPLLTGQGPAMAQTVSLDRAIADSQAAIPRQTGGNHDELAPFKGGRRRQRKRQSRGRKSQRRQRSQRNQRGGMADFNASSTLGFALPGVNEQFANENKVMGGWYNPTQGAQGPSVGRY